MNAKEALDANPGRYQDETGNWLPTRQIATLLTVGNC